MSRSMTAQDTAHAQQRVTFWAQCIKVSRGDAEVVRMTSLDRELTVALEDDPLELNGTYLPLSNFDTTTLRQSSDLAVDNAEIGALLADAGVNEQDIRAGEYEDASYVLLLVNWKDPTNSGVVLKQGPVGHINDFLQQLARIELRGLTQYLDQAIVEAVGPTCRYVLGDERCTVDLSAFSYVGEVTGVPVQRRKIESLIVAAGSPAAPEPIGAWFKGGEIEWLTGSNAGRRERIKEDDENGDLTLFQPTPYDIGIGDQFIPVPGCDHAHLVVDGVATGDCYNKYDNVLNFGGEPDVPSQFSIVESPD